MSQFNTLTLVHQYFDFSSCPDIQIMPGDTYTQSCMRKRQVFVEKGVVFVRSDCDTITLLLSISSGDYYLYSDIQDFEHFEGQGVSLVPDGPENCLVDHQKAFSQQGGQLICLVTMNTGQNYQLLFGSRTCHWQYVIHADIQQYPDMEVESNRLTDSVHNQDEPIGFEPSDSAQADFVFTSDRAISMNRAVGGLFKLTFSLGNAGRQDLCDPLPNPGPSSVQANWQHSGFVAVQHLYL